MVPEADLLTVIKRHALLNAVKHDGRAESETVLGNLLGERPDLRPKARELLQVTEQVVGEVNRLSAAEQLEIVELSWPGELTEPRKVEVGEKRLPPLPNVEKYAQVVTRFAPNPDFALHVGHARAVVLSHDYARMYKGKFILRFEDTDPRLKKSALEYYEQIREDLRWLGSEWDDEVIQSDRLSIYYEHAAKLIGAEGAYVCECSADSFRAHVAKSAVCPCRDLGVNEQMRRWERMLRAGYQEGGAVVRVKTELGHPNPAIRDWPALRIIDPTKYPHPRVGSKFRVWPLYNFAAGVDDHLLGVTHILRGKDHLTNTERQKYMYKHLGWDYPEAIHYGRLNLVDARLSKSQMMRELEAGKYRDLSDPRLPTFAALRRRGIQAAAIQQMMWGIGPRPVDSSVSWEILYALNRKIVDPAAPRYFFVEDPKPVHISGLTQSRYQALLPLHPGSPDSEKRSIEFESPYGAATLYISGSDFRSSREGSEVRLMELFNNRFVRLADTEASGIRVSDSYQEARETGLQLIQWLPKENSVPGEVLLPDGRESRGLFEKNIVREQREQVVQLVRFGFARLDEVSENRVVAYFAHT